MTTIGGECPYCNFTGGAHETNCPMAKQPERPAMVGWICPVCGKGVSPFMPSCDGYHPNPSIRLYTSTTTKPQDWGQ